MKRNTDSVKGTVLNELALADASTQDLKRLLELFPVANLRQSWPDLKGTKEELCFAIAEQHDLARIATFVHENVGCCKQHVYIFSRPSDFDHLPGQLPSGSMVRDLNGIEALYIVRSQYTVVLRDPLDETSLDFLWPIRIDVTPDNIIVRIVVLEKSLAAYFDRSCYVADRNVEEKDILVSLASIVQQRADLHKGIKKLWEDGFMDSPRTKYKKAISSAWEATDEERGIREHNPELFDELQNAMLLNTLFVIPDEKGSSVGAFSVDPSNGYVAFTSYSNKGDTDFVIHEILKQNQ